MISLDSYESFTRGLADLEYFGQKLGLDRIRALLSRLGNPQDKFSSIHFAGTNGKGSTAAMLASIFQEGGYRVGLYTSPHLEDFCERIRINGQFIDQEQVLKYARAVREVEDDPLTFFELATAIGFLHFAEEGVDLAVVETGLGGRLDATNVLKPLVSVITTIGRDHTQQLGSSVEEIAFEKAGIIKPGKPVVVGALPAEAMEVVREQAAVKGSRFVPLVMDLIPPNIQIGLEGAHQRRNANLALGVADVLAATGGPSVDRDAVWRGLEEVRWPGRLETVSNEPWVVLDGAHNPDAMAAVREFLEENLDGRRLRLIFGAMADKDIRGMLAEILPLADEVIVTAPKLKRAASPEVLAEIVSPFDIEPVVCQDVSTALEKVSSEMAQDEVLLITGSFFLIGEAKKWLAQKS